MSKRKWNKEGKSVNLEGITYDFDKKCLLNKGDARWLKRK